MTEAAAKPRERLLDPIARISEILFGLIMVLTFTGSFSVSISGEGETRQMLIGAIGCNLAWGIVDAVMYLMSSLTERAHGLKTLGKVRSAADPHEAHREIADALPPIVASVLEETELETVRQRLSKLTDPPVRRLLKKDDWLAAVGVFLLVFLSTFPVVLPFVFMDDARIALRVSNAIAIVMLFACGYSLGRHAGQSGWLIGLIMVVIGMFLAGMTLALGG